MLDSDIHLNNLHHALSRDDDTYRSIIVNGEDTHYKIDREGNVFSTFIKYQDSSPVKRTYIRPGRDEVPRCQIHVGGRGNRRNKFYYLDKLVANAFLPNPHGYKYLVHLDYRLHNVKADNLRWVDKKTWQEYRYHRLAKMMGQGKVRLVPNTSYYVDEMGSFRSIHHPAKSARKIRELHGNGVILRSHGHRKLYPADRTVAETFLSNPHHLPYVYHLNHDNHDDRASNLTWCGWNDLVLHKYIYSNPSLHGLQIVKLNGSYALYVSDQGGQPYSLLNSRKSKEHYRNSSSKFFVLRINGKEYRWTRAQILKHSYPIPPVASQDK